MKYILEMANNHMGSVEHGREIIRAFAETVDFSAGDHFIKFQYRDLDTYIDASVKGNTNFPARSSRDHAFPQQGHEEDVVTPRGQWCINDRRM